MSGTSFFESNTKVKTIQFICVT